MSASEKCLGLLYVKMRGDSEKHGKMMKTLPESEEGRFLNQVPALSAEIMSLIEC